MFRSKSFKRTKIARDTDDVDMSVPQQDSQSSTAEPRKRLTGRSLLPRFRRQAAVQLYATFRVCLYRADKAALQLWASSFDQLIADPGTTRVMIYYTNRYHFQQLVQQRLKNFSKKSVVTKTSSSGKHASASKILKQLQMVHSKPRQTRYTKNTLLIWHPTWLAFINDCQTIYLPYYRSTQITQQEPT